MNPNLIEQPFKKAILFVGPARSGKSRLANLMVKGQPGVITLDARRFKSSMLSKLPADTRILRLEDMKIKNLEDLFSCITGGIGIVKKGGVTETIYPQIIITCEADMEDVGSGGSWDARFDIFHIAECN